MTRVAVVAALALAWSQAFAQGYPSKPITFIIPFGAGGDSDLSGRNVGQHAAKYLNNQPIVPVNRVVGPVVFRIWPVGTFGRIPSD